MLVRLSRRRPLLAPLILRAMATLQFLAPYLAQRTSKDGIVLIKHWALHPASMPSFTTPKAIVVLELTCKLRFILNVYIISYDLSSASTPNDSHQALFKLECRSIDALLMACEQIQKHHQPGSLRYRGVDSMRPFPTTIQFFRLDGQVRSPIRDRHFEDPASILSLPDDLQPYPGHPARCGIH